MTESFNIEDSKKFREHINSLLRIYYGLAIATGTAYAVREIINNWPRNIGYLPFAATALLIGIADWMICHLSLIKHEYKSYKRLLLDLVFPLIIFIMFQLVGHPKPFLIFLLVYYILSLVYMTLLLKEGWAPPEYLLIAVPICFGVIFISTLFILLVSSTWILIAVIIALCITSLTYIIANIGYANNALKIDCSRDHESHDSDLQNEMQRSADAMDINKIKGNTNKIFGWPQWISSAAAICAVLISVIALINSREALDFQKQEAALKRATNIKINTSWSWGKVYFEGFHKTTLLTFDSTNSKEIWEHKFSGLDFFAKIKLFNASEHDVSIDVVSGNIIYKGGISSELSSANCFEEDSETKLKFPILIKPNEQKCVHLRLPLPVDSNIVNVFSLLEPNRTYSAEEIVRQYNERGAVVVTGDSYPRSLSLIFMEYILPSSSSNNWEYCSFDLYVHLASGESIEKRLDILLEEI
jgi:hypothetical protein